MQQPQWLGDDPAIFPCSTAALKDPNGLIAIGGDLSPARLLNAYARGIFPWFNEDQPILWWTPSPRMVFLPGEVHASKSLRKHLKKHALSVSIDRCFAKVIDACQAPRKDDKPDEENGTWITEEMREAYNALHQLGYAHSIEVWDAQGQLIGGLYGVALGPVFFGESMFSRASNASKVAIWVLSNWAKGHGFTLIDCQVENEHLASLGGKTMARDVFEQYLPDSQDSIECFQTCWHNAKKSIIYPIER